jgi:hypothetical protein
VSAWLPCWPRGEVGAADDGVADFDGGDAVADGLDDAGEVDAEDDRRRRTDQSRGEAQRAALAHLPVDRVDADRLDGDAELAGARRRGGQLEQDERFALRPAALRHGLHRRSGGHGAGW